MYVSNGNDLKSGMLCWDLKNQVKIIMISHFKVELIFGNGYYISLIFTDIRKKKHFGTTDSGLI